MNLSRLAQFYNNMYFWTNNVTATIETLNENGIHAQKSTSNNDLCPSVSIGDEFKLMLPNSEKHDIDAEEFNTYLLYHHDKDGFIITDIEFNTLQGFINYFKSL